MCWHVGCSAWSSLLWRGDQAKDASCWCSGMRTRCCSGMLAGCGTSRPTGCGSPRWHGSYRAGAGLKYSPWRPRHSWPGTACWPRRNTTRASGASPAARRRSQALHALPFALRGRIRCGAPPDPRRTAKTRRDGRAVHRVGDPPRRRRRPGAAPLGSELAAVPSGPGSRDPRSRLPACGHRAAEAPLRPGVHRAQHTPDAPRRCDREPDRRVGRAAGPLPRHEPR
jgi:hypothetical protein